MVKVITVCALFMSTFIVAQSQFEGGMAKGFELWGAGKNDEASAMFERIASAEKNSWLPNYYVALVNTTASFQTKDKEKINALLAKAQDALDKELALDQSNAELMVLQAMIYTAWVVYDPMTNGMKYSSKVMAEYAKAEGIAPNNPRVIFGKAEYEIGGAKYFGKDIKPMCAEIERAVTLFATFKPESAFHPSWGLDRALEAQKECNK